MVEKKVIFSSLANNQTEFWINVSKKLKINYKSIIAFDNESTKKHAEKYLIDLTFKKKIINLKLIKIYLRKYEITNLKKTLNHEILNSETKNSYLILCKLTFYLIKLEDTFKNNNLIIFQELGGFIQNLSIFFFCKKNGIKHYFLEPSFFSGRLHCIEDSFTDFSAKKKYSKISDLDLSNLLHHIVSKKKLVIPIKDKLHFQAPIKKFITFRNLFRFFYKIYLKTFLKYEFVFYQNFNTLQKYLSEILSFIVFKKHYINKLPQNFIYFPLHVPNDFALTLRATEYQNQIILINKICKIYKENKDLYICIKEHPARIGALKLKKLLHNQNLIFLNPKMNNFDIFSKSLGVITLNSKAGFEAILSGNMVISLTHSFYSHYKLSEGPINIESLQKYNFSRFKKTKNVNKKKNQHFFKKIYENSIVGELYSNDITNIKYFSDSLKKVLDNN